MTKNKILLEFLRNITEYWVYVGIYLFNPSWTKIESHGKRQ